MSDLTMTPNSLWHLVREFCGYSNSVTTEKLLTVMRDDDLMVALDGIHRARRARHEVESARIAVLEEAVAVARDEIHKQSSAEMATLRKDWRRKQRATALPPSTAP